VKDELEGVLFSLSEVKKFEKIFVLFSVQKREEVDKNFKIV